MISCPKELQSEIGKAPKERSWSTFLDNESNYPCKEAVGSATKASLEPDLFNEDGPKLHNKFLYRISNRVQALSSFLSNIDPLHEESIVCLDGSYNPS